MDNFLVGERRSLEFHTVVLDLLRDHPNLIERARQALAKTRAGHPNPDGVLDRWRTLLDGTPEAMAPALLADDPAGGLLRANSPFNGLFSIEERNAVWQRVGLRQFARLFLDAADDLALSAAELARIVGIAAEELEDWRRNPAADPGRLDAGAAETARLGAAQPRRPVASARRPPRLAARRQQHPRRPPDRPAAGR